MGLIGYKGGWGINDHKPGLRLVKGRAAGPQKPKPPLTMGDFLAFWEGIPPRHFAPSTRLLMSIRTAEAFDDMMQNWDQYTAMWRKQRREKARRKRRKIGRGRW